MAPAALTLPVASRRLIGMYEVRGWWPARSCFEVMVGAVLVQNTRWPNVAAALRSLRAAGCLSPGKISTLESADLSTLIRPAGCQTVKARRLQALCDWLTHAGGLRTLARLDDDALRSALLSVHGIGYETADAILCFGFDRPRFVADKYARQWIGRMGLAVADEVAGYERCRTYVERELRRSRIDLAHLHAAIVLHAQAVCRKQPHCSACTLRQDCAFVTGRRCSAR